VDKDRQYSDLTPWVPAPTQLPEDWVALSNDLAEQVKGSLRAYVLGMKYDAQRVGDLLRSWGLPWQVVMAGYLWEYDEDKIHSANLRDVDSVIRHIGEANIYSTYIEDGVLPPLLTPPYHDLGALLIAGAIYYEALKTIQQRSTEQPYRGEKVLQIESIGHTLLNITKNLGIWNFKREIEDLIEQIRSPHKFLEQKQEHDQILKQDAAQLEDICQLLIRTYQQAAQFPIEVVYTACGVTGLERRIQDAHTTATSQKIQLTGCDLVTFEVIVPTVQECYNALGIFSQIGRIQDRVTDLISNPKPNGCSHIALGLEMKSSERHITTGPLKDFSSTTCQLQISTHPMAAIARYGCLYPIYYQIYSGQTNVDKINIPDLSYVWKSTEGWVIDTLKEQLTAVPFQSDIKKPIVVYDKNRSAIALPQDATALDFAYKLDSDLGEHAVEAFINNRKAPLYRKLDAGDIIEIRTSNDVQTQPYWIEENYATTPIAQQHIKQSLDRRSYDRKGYFLIRQELEHYHYMFAPDELDYELRKLEKKHSLGAIQAYLEQVEEKKEPPYTPEWAAQEIMSQVSERKESTPSGTGRSNWVPKPDTPSLVNQKFLRLPRPCNACRPRYPRDMKIKGLLKRRGELVVHKQSCPFLIERTESQQSQILSMHWELQPPAFKVAFFIVARDRTGLILDIVKQLRRYECNLLSISGEAIFKFKEAQVRFTIEAYVDEEILTIWQALAKVESVLNVELNAAATPRATYERIQKLRSQNGGVSDRVRIQPTWEESIETLGLRKPELKNPYDISHPARGKMFFGRQREIRLMQRVLCESDQGKAILLYGPRRSGKSSICKHFLENHVHSPFWSVMFSLQNFTRHTEEAILEELAKKICRAFHEQLQLPAPDWEQYPGVDAQLRFRHIVEDCIAKVAGTRLVLALDEFGGVLEAYEKQFLDYRFFTYWKELMNEIPQLSLIFALPTSSHLTLTRDFSNVFSFAEPLRVSFLDKESAERLLIDPLKDQHIAIRPDTIDLATMLAGGNPYYMTLIGLQTVNLLNADIYKQHINDEDLQIVIESLIEANFNQSFDFLKRELQNQDELQVLETIVEITGRTNQQQVQLKKIAHKLNWSFSKTKQHVDRLKNALILHLEEPSNNPYCSFTIELVRRWMASNYWFFTP
jgi:GTP pyrophosphokinase